MADEINQQTYKATQYTVDLTIPKDTINEKAALKKRLKKKKKYLMSS